MDRGQIEVITTVSTKPLILREKKRTLREMHVYTVVPGFKNKSKFC